MSGFTFKQFHIEQERCAMKVGTDGILLGAWADISQRQRILDMGTGTGLVALMLAQRSDANCQIIGVELDPDAAAQAAENVANSLWSEKIQIVSQDIADFTQNCVENALKFDLIVANPPYFAQGVDCHSHQRNQARYTLTQSHLDWLNWAANCLNDKGKITFILPFDAAKILQKSTALYCVEACQIITKTGKTPQRMLISFSKHQQPFIQTELVIYNEQNQYTDEFVALTRDFYLKM